MKIDGRKILKIGIIAKKYALHVCILAVITLSFTVFQLGGLFIKRLFVPPAELGIPEESYVDSTVTYKTEQKGDSVYRAVPSVPKIYKFPAYPSEPCCNHRCLADPTQRALAKERADSAYITALEFWVSNK